MFTKEEPIYPSRKGGRGSLNRLSGNYCLNPLRRYRRFWGQYSNIKNEERYLYCAREIASEGRWQMQRLVQVSF